MNDINPWRGLQVTPNDTMDISPGHHLNKSFVSHPEDLAMFFPSIEKIQEAESTILANEISPWRGLPTASMSG